MTTATATFSWSFSNVTAEKAWIDGVHNLLTTVGLVQTTDTGQLDTTTITVTPTNASTIGYHLFKFPDTLQATTPILIKVSYKADSSLFANIVLEVGAASNGAGSIASPSFAVASSGNQTLQANLTSYACYIDGTFTMVLGYAAVSGLLDNNSVANLVVDRARDATGTALASGFLAESSALSSVAYSRSLYGGASPATSSSFVPSLIPSLSAASSSEGANVNVFRHYMMTPGVKPSLGSLTYFSSEFGALTPFTATVLGSSHTYLPVGVAMNGWSANPVRAHCAAIRWE